LGAEERFLRGFSGPVVIHHLIFENVAVWVSCCWFLKSGREDPFDVTLPEFSPSDGIHVFVSLLIF
jgi:hypothetical protein